MLYNKIPMDEYSRKYGEIQNKILHLGFENSTESLGKTLFMTVKYSLYFHIDDYSVFLAHYSQHKDMDTMYLGLKSAQNFSSFWEYIGYALNLTYHLGLNNDGVNFKKSICLAREYFKGYNKPVKMLTQLEQIFDSCNRENRNESTHRYLSIFFRDESNMDIDKMVDAIVLDLKDGFNKIINGLSIYHQLVKEYDPISVINIKQD